MPRDRGTDSNGASFSQAVIDQVWAKGRAFPNDDSWVWRYDICGMPIMESQLGNTDSEHGWEIDHILPVSLGGGDDIANLQPLQWDNNRRKGDTYPWN